ncbi:MAG: ATP-binding protein, partial [Salinimicrobium sp.]
KQYEIEEEFREISSDDSSVLIIDRWTPLSVSKNEPVIRSVMVLKWQDEKWIPIHKHMFLKEEASYNSLLQSENKALKTSLSEKDASLIQSRELVKKNREQLLHKEKLANLGQLSAGIAHEIKNPLNFINNFSELSKEYITEVFENLEQMKENSVPKEVIELLKNVQINLEKIHDHSSRVDRIVRSMLMHSRGEGGNKELTDLNGLIKEFVNLAFHGMRANQKPINVDISLDLDENIEPVVINPEEFSRVILNLCNNAFDAMREKILMRESANLAVVGDSSNLSRKKYLPKLKVSTKQKVGSVNICIEDNGSGVPNDIKDKLMMPFFTTKRAKEGTGLGLSITQDIIKDHKGRINISSKENEFTRFNITLPSLGKKKK